MIEKFLHWIRKDDCLYGHIGPAEVLDAFKRISCYDNPGSKFFVTYKCDHCKGKWDVEVTETNYYDWQLLKNPKYV